MSKLAGGAENHVHKRMAAVRQRGTGPELIVRGVLKSLGLRYRTTVRSLPGSPDVANHSRRWAIFVHGCFWHAHDGCRYFSVPRRNRAFWLAKFARNRTRDAEAVRELRKHDYRVVTIWQCELQRISMVRRKLAKLMAAATGRERGELHGAYPNDRRPIRDSPARRVRKPLKNQGIARRMSVPNSKRGLPNG